VREELRGLDILIEPAAGDAVDGIWSELVEFQSLGDITFKANFRSSVATEFFDEVVREPVTWAVRVHAGNGIAHGLAAPPPESMDRLYREVSESVARLRTLAVQRQGNLVMLRCPTEWKSRIPVWGEPRGDGWLMQAIKRKLDPQNVLNPGRF
jgi:glycolate oxidase FAD binding subunit